MKNNTIVNLTIMSLFSFYCFAQKTKASLNENKKEEIHYSSESLSNAAKPIRLYYVEERINMKFGGRISTYYISDLKLIKPYDLGPGNTRIITPVYAEDKKIPYKTIANIKPTDPSLHTNPIANIPPLIDSNTIENINSTKKPIVNANQIDKIDWAIPLLNSKKVDNTNYKKTDSIAIAKSILISNETNTIIETPLINSNMVNATDNPKKTNNIASVDIIRTYEKMTEKGFKSIDMFKKMGDAYYFSGELDKAAKYYKELFAMANDLEAEYYYRYSASLKAIGESKKANEFLEKFNQLSGNTLKK